MGWGWGGGVGGIGGVKEGGSTMPGMVLIACIEVKSVGI